jgi:FMN-dependent NADH-azoreductase
MAILFINACVRENSRTLVLAKKILGDASDNVIEVNLNESHIMPLNRELLSKREKLLEEGDENAPMLSYAKQFAEADEIVIAAPFWDLSFPALLKIYIEQITVAGVTFAYQNGVPFGLCRAKRLTYVTTSGGPIIHNFGFDYTYALATSFYGIADVRCIKAEGLDIRGADVDSIMDRAKASVTEILGADTK